MEPKITAEWLQTMVGDDDYEPSALITPNDRVELARRKAERLQNATLDTPKMAEDDQDESGVPSPARSEVAPPTKAGR